MAEKKFSGRLFRVGTILATDSIKLKVRLLKIVGGGVERLPAILAGRSNPELKAAADAAAVAALSDIFNKADPEGVVDLLRDIVAMAQIQGESKSWEDADIDQDFTTHKKDLYPVVFWVLKEALGDFFSELPENGDLRKMMRG